MVSVSHLKAQMGELIIRLLISSVTSYYTASQDAKAKGVRFILSDQ